MDIDFDLVLKNIEQIFVNEEAYGFDKHIWEFKQGGEYLGDTVIFTMAENSNPPTFYNVISPYDEVSKKAPQHALVFKNGTLIFQADFTNYTDMRTGAMDALVLKNLGLVSLKDKRILMFGRGKTATWSHKFLAHIYPDLPTITTINSQTPTADYDIGQFDIILCHTNTKEPVLRVPDKIKPGAIITNFISTPENTEVHSSLFDLNTVNIVIDWKPNLTRTPEIKDHTNVIELKNLFNKTQTLDNSKKYSIFRFLGTPLQNLAVLKTLVPL